MAWTNWLTLDRTVDSRLPFGGVIKPGRSERGGVAGLEGSVADRTIDAWSRTASDREPGGSERYSLAAALWGALAGRAGEVRQVEHDLSAVLALERGRHLGDRVGHPGRDDGGHRPLQHRQYHHPRPRLGSGGKRGTHRQALGRSRGGFGCKVHCIADAGGRPLAFHLTGGQAADCKAYDTLIALPEVEPAALLGDKGYDADAIRDGLRGRGIDAVIPGRSNRKKPIIHDRILYKERNRIERMFGHLKTNRAVATRYDQLAESFLSMIQIAATRYLLKFVHAA